VRRAVIRNPIHFPGAITTPVAGFLASLLLISSTVGQTVLISDLRRIATTARAGDVTDSDAFTPSPAFSRFDLADDADATFGTCSTAARATQTSTVTPVAFAAVGTARASGTSPGSDLGSAQASSSYFISFRLASAQRLTLAATLTRGTTANPQFVLQRSDGMISYVLSGNDPQPITIARTLPPGDYTLVTFASVSISLFPGATLNDTASFSLDATLTCPADFNADGFLDFFDYDDFVACFETGVCPPNASADFNEDGFADFFDYDAFVASFESGC
jgi:hypothetical protein